MLGAAGMGQAKTTATSGQGGDADGDPTWAEIVRAVSSAKQPMLVLHVRPDGDSVGSSLAVARCLRQLGKHPTVVSPDMVPANLTFLDPDGACVPATSAAGPFDLGLFLDCADLDRLGSAQALVPALPRVVNIDHHPSNNRYGHLNYVDARAAACAELALRLIDDLGCSLDPQMATALYAALATDTGSFRFTSTSPRTLSMAARLRAAGADLDLISREIWENRSLSSVRLLAQALQTLEVDPSGEMAWLSVKPDQMARAGADASATEGLVDYARTLRGVQVALLFTACTATETRVSLRSKGRVDVSALAGQFGGGGHARAAGCTVQGALPEVRARVLAATGQALAQAHGDTAP